ncbi:hypothetical protein [Methylobacillus sp.]|uniref:hypothetical protein n=1 Tax=Methylobacillus sp. TaxID=56818 RepID=UPI0012CC8EA3|nr:hypothetical protein [Methylobacillus sp.]MPS49035.1 hypothetical protein [Methylobacillus sp.]
MQDDNCNIYEVVLCQLRRKLHPWFHAGERYFFFSKFHKELIMKASALLKTLMASAAVATVTMPEIASATSLLPATALDGIGTDAIDTVTDIAVKFIPVVAGVSIGWFILSAAKKGLGKAGVK